LDNFAVNSRKAICLLVLIFIPLASLGLVPFGHGPSSVVDGPRTAFRAYRASLELKFAVTSAVAIAAAFVIAFSDLCYPDLDSEPRLASLSPSFPLPCLRC
jgi:hypothetical protein